MLVFFLGFLPPSRLGPPGHLRHSAASSQNGSSADVSSGWGRPPDEPPPPWPPKLWPPPEPRAFTPVVAVDLSSGPAEAGADLIGDDLDHAALLAVLGLIGPLLEAPGDDRPRALRQRGRRVLAQLAPCGHVEERGLLLPLAVLLVPAAHGDAERGDGLPGLGEPEFGIPGEVSDEGDSAVSHGCPAFQPTCSTMPRRAASWSGRRRSLWRTTSSARRRWRSSSSSEPGGATTLKKT